MNKVFLIGNLTRDPDIAETNGGVSVCKFSIAVNRSYTDSEGNRGVDYFNVTVWRGLAEAVARYCKKGNKIAVTGSVQIRNYEDNGGNKRTAVDIIAQDVEFLSPKREEGERPAGAPQREGVRYMAEDDGDIPF